VKSKIREHLDLTLPEFFIPEMGEPKKGKVRDIYFWRDYVVMVTNDRVSAFGYILPNLIPFKGQVLNMISEYTISQTSDVLPNALVQNVDASVVVQKKMKNLNVEWIVRGFLWGSMAAAYGKGDRKFCGLSVPDGLNRFQKFDEPLLTPTTKTEVGHDENMTMEEVEQLVGKEMAKQAKDAALRLFKRGQDVMQKRGLILIDTKYEFGLDEQGKLYVIDEVNTPDSSCLCSIEEWETKYPKIVAEMATGQYKTVNDVLEAKPELEIKEFSKQYVGDALLEMGFNPTRDKYAPTLSDDQVVECAWRYISIYERITGVTFVFPEANMAPSKRIVTNLQRSGLIVGGFVAIFAGSDSDLPYFEEIQEELAKFNIPSQIEVLSADTQPGRLEGLIAHYNKSTEPLLVVGCPGGTDALPCTGSYPSNGFTISCSPDGLNSTCVTKSPRSPNSFVVKPANLAKFAANAFARCCPVVAAALQAHLLMQYREMGNELSEDSCRKGNRAVQMF